MTNERGITIQMTNEDKLKLAIAEYIEAIKEQIAKEHDAPLPDKLMRELYNATCRAALEVCLNGLQKALDKHGALI